MELDDTLHEYYHQTNQNKNKIKIEFKNDAVVSILIEKITQGIKDIYEK